MKLHFNVLQRHIDAGKRADGNDCPVALAVREAGHECSVGDGHELSVGDDLVIDGKRYGWSKELYSFIGDFDKGSQVEPFSFDLTDDDEIKDEEEGE